jgi:hypothetical protein
VSAARLTPPPTQAEIRATLAVVCTIAEAIRELGSVPNGHLYANACSHLTIGEYTSVIDLLKRTGLVTEQAHVLTWTGERK